MDNPTHPLPALDGVGGDERIVAAAIILDCGMMVSAQPPMRHHDCMRIARERGRDGRVPPDRQGFETNTGRFVGRIEAMAIACAAGQLVLRPEVPLLDELFSENLW